MGFELAEAYVDVPVRQRSLDTGLATARAKIQKFSAGARSVALKAGMLAGVMAGSFGILAKKAADFESSMAEVEKVTDASTVEAMSNEILRMGQNIPKTTEELAHMTAQAARFGVRGTENLRNFTEITSKMTVATDLAANEAGMALAKLTTLTGTSTDAIENMGSAINSLGNNFAVSQSEVVDSTLRAGAALKQFGLRQTETFALAASLNEVSESARRAGTRLRSMAMELMDPKKVKSIAEAIGMTGESFKTLRDNSPIQAIKRLAMTFKNGGAAAERLRGALSRVGQQAIGSLSENLDGLDEALRVSQKQFDLATSLEREFGIEMDTVSAKMQIAKNRASILAIVLGDALEPTTRALAERVSGLLRNMIAWTMENKETAETVMTLGAYATGAVAGVAALAGGIWVLSAATTTLLSTATPIVGLLAAIAVGSALAADSFGLFGGSVIELVSQIGIIDKFWTSLAAGFLRTEYLVTNLANSIPKYWHLAWAGVKQDASDAISKVIDILSYGWSMVDKVLGTEMGARLEDAARMVEEKLENSAEASKKSADAIADAGQNLATQNEQAVSRLWADYHKRQRDNVGETENAMDKIEKKMGDKANSIQNKLKKSMEDAGEAVKGAGDKASEALDKANQSAKNLRSTATESIGQYLTTVLARKGKSGRNAVLAAAAGVGAVGGRRVQATRAPTTVTGDGSAGGGKVAETRNRKQEAKLQELVQEQQTTNDRLDSLIQKTGLG